MLKVNKNGITAFAYNSTLNEKEGSAVRLTEGRALCGSAEIIRRIIISPCHVSTADEG